MQLVDIMRHVELFRGLNQDQLQLIRDISTKDMFEIGDVIFKQGDEGDKMYIIAKGQVEVKIHKSDGTTQIPVFLGTGQVFGEMALIDKARRSATLAAAEKETIVYSIPTDNFTNLCESNTDIGYIMMRNIAQDLSFKLRHRDTDLSQSE